jgi:hypothetical protein
MKSFAPVTRRFIAAAWRRILLIRIAESIAISSAISSALGLILVTILWLQGKPAFSFAAGILATGCLAGLIWGISRRPTRLQAAIEADRQLGLHDLLGTAVLLHQNPQHSQWDTAFADYADDRCKALSPSAIIARRIGLRGWAGAGILGALLLTLSLFTTRPSEVTAATFPLASAASIPTPNPSLAASFPPNTSDVPIESRPPGPGGADDDSHRNFPTERPDQSTNATSPTNPSSVHTSSGTTSGAGSARTQNDSPLPAAAPLQSTPTRPQFPTGTKTAGNGPSDARTSPGGEKNNLTVAPSSSNHVVPWNSPHWPAITTAANQALSTGQVPDEDSDLVRDYFRRD